MLIISTLLGLIHFINLVRQTGIVPIYRWGSRGLKKWLAQGLRVGKFVGPHGWLHSPCSRLLPQGTPVFSTWWQTENCNICMVHCCEWTPVEKLCTSPWKINSVYRTPPLAHKLSAGSDLTSVGWCGILSAWYLVRPAFVDEMNEQYLTNHLSCSLFFFFTELKEVA